jgi:hypothetical protein
MVDSRERKLRSLETEYETSLRAALERCADGQWGLFGHNNSVHEQLGKREKVRLSSQDANDLLELGAQIERLRDELGYQETFALHERLLQMRSSNNANTPGEPKLAQSWLDEIAR